MDYPDNPDDPDVFFRFSDWPFWVFSAVRIFLKLYFAKWRPPSCRRRRDDQNASSSTQLRKNDSLSFEGKDLAKRVAKTFQQSSQGKKDRRVNEKLAPVVLSYLNSWDRKCERLGRANFGLNQPAGFLTIELTLLSDGRLKSAQIVKSSRVTELDKHALKTAERAAPHLPFPPEMRKNYSKLTFQRTWQYGRYRTTINST